MSKRYKNFSICAKLSKRVIILLNIDMEFKKGILFVRLKGVLNKKTIGKLHDEVTILVKDNGIRNIVFNISELISIDYYGINALLCNYELVKQKYTFNEYVTRHKKLYEEILVRGEKIMQKVDER